MESSGEEKISSVKSTGDVVDETSVEELMSVLDALWCVCCVSEREWSATMK